MNINYQKQLKKTQILVEQLPWENPEFYNFFMAQTYYFVRHSTRLLAKSISYFGVDRDNLYRRFVAHLKEENYHEKLAINDLKHSNLHPNDYSELPITKAFWETQYYKIDQTKGISLLGYILYLEAIPVFSFQGILKYLPSKSSSFARVHMDEDPNHVQHALDMINELSEKEQLEIWENFNQSAELYQMMLLKIAEVTKCSIKIA